MGTKKLAYVNNEILLWARQKTPFYSTADVENRIKDIKAENLDLWEAGIELPSITEAKKLASLYKVPFACFYLSSPPENEPKNYVDRRTYGGTVYRDLSYELWEKIEHIKQNRRIMLEVDEDNECFDIPYFSSEVVVSDIADKIRDFLGIKLPFSKKCIYKNNAFNYFRNILEGKGIIVAQISGVSLEEMKGISIYYDKYPIIAVNNKDYERAKVFSLFHELAHIVRRSSSLCMIDFDDRNDIEEKTCDRIAAEILMPRDLFVDEVGLASKNIEDWNSLRLQAIGDRFAVSSLSVVRRMYELSIISYKLYQSMYKRLVEEFETKHISANTGEDFHISFYIKYLSREGRLFPRTVVSAYYRGDLSFGEMCKTLNVKSKHIDNIERVVML